MSRRAAAVSRVQRAGLGFLPRGAGGLGPGCGCSGRPVGLHGAPQSTLQCTGPVSASALQCRVHHTAQGGGLATSPGSGAASVWCPLQPSLAWDTHLHPGVPGLISTGHCQTLLDAGATTRGGSVVSVQQAPRTSLLPCPPAHQSCHQLPFQCCRDERPPWGRDRAPGPAGDGQS